MVAVALSPQVVQVPMPSVEEHIQQLKAAARLQSSTVSESAKPALPDNKGSSPENGPAKGAYLPPPEIARQIPCRYWPNCSYGDQCLFYHDQSLSSSLPASNGHVGQGQGQANDSSNEGTDRSAYGLQNGQQQQGHGYPAPGPNGYDMHAMMQMPPMYYPMPGPLPHGQFEGIEYMQAAYAGYPQPYFGYPAHQQGQGQGQGQDQQFSYATSPNGPAYPSYQYPRASQYPGSAMYQPEFIGSPQANGTPLEQATEQSSVEPPKESTNDSSENAKASKDTPVVQSTKEESASVQDSQHVNQQQNASPSNSNPATSPAVIPSPLSPASYPENVQLNGYHPYYPGAPVPLHLAQQLPVMHLNGQQPAPANMHHRRERSLSQAANASGVSNSPHMHTFFQTGGAQPYPAAPSFNGQVGPTNARALNGHTGPGSFPQRRNDLTATSGHAKRGAFGHSSSSSRSALAASTNRRGGAPAFLDPNKPIPACTYFQEGRCRYADNCQFLHILEQERQVPGAEEGKVTKDAKILKMNICSPKGDVNQLPSWPPRPTKADFAAEKKLGATRASSASGQPKVVNQPAVSTAEATTDSAASVPKPQLVQNVQISKDADVKEKFETLISETRSLPPHDKASTPAAMNAPTAPRQFQANGPFPGRQNNQGTRRPAHPHPKFTNPQSHQPAFPLTRNTQRVPSGENDFPALPPTTAAPTSAAMAKSPSSGSSSDGKKDAATVVAAPPVVTPTTTPAVAAAPASKPASPAPIGPAPTKSTFSWASAAAKAASLPDPPKRAPSKPRVAAALATKKETADAAGSSEPAESGVAEAPATLASQTLTAEATSAPIVKA